MSVGVKLLGDISEFFFGTTPTKLMGVIDINPEDNTPEIQVDDHDGADSMAGNEKASFTVNCNYLDTDTSQIGLKALKDGALHPFEVRPAGTGVGKTKLAFTGRVLKVSGPTAPTQGGQKITFSVSAKGGVTWGVQP